MARTTGEGGKRAGERNTGTAGNRDIVNSTQAGKPTNGGRGSMGKTIGPMTATTKLGGSSLVRGHVGPEGAPYIDKPR